MATTTAEARLAYARASVHILLTLARPIEVPDDWTPPPARVVELARAFYRTEITTSDADAALAELPAADVQLSIGGE